MPSKFHLDKIYLDCIDAKGNCFIIYSARIKFFFLRLNYSALLFSAQDDSIKELSSFQRNTIPLISPVIKLASQRFRLSGNWTRKDDPIRLLLYKDPKGRGLLWDCHHPKAETKIIFNDRCYTGYGYAETISLSFPPQRLPIDELLWGRFLSPNHTIIWIHWKGAHPLTKIFYDGRVFEDGIFEENRITFGANEHVLTFEEPIALTTRQLSSVFDAVPFLKIFFSKRLLKTKENKFKAHSSFTSPGSTRDQGYALFETVTFGK